MSALPRAVQQQLDEADRILAQGATPPVAPVEPPAPPAEPPQPQPAANTPPEPQPAPQPAEPPQDAAYWKARFDTMAGKYAAEVPRLSQALTDMQVQIRSIETARQQAPAPAATPPAALVTEKDDEKFGSDLIDLVRRVAREERRPVEQVLGQVDQTIRQLAPQVARVQQVEKQMAGNREEQFYSALANVVPDWETVNKDARWIKWLEEYEPVAGKTRQQSLDEAAGTYDVRRTIGLFKLFKGSLPVQPPAPPQPSSELARQVAPSRSATTSVTPASEKIFSGAEYAHWMDYRRIHDTPKEHLEKMLAEVERALAEGRVRF